MCISLERPMQTGQDYSARTDHPFSSLRPCIQVSQGEQSVAGSHCRLQDAAEPSGPFPQPAVPPSVLHDPSLLVPWLKAETLKHDMVTAPCT